MGKESNKKKSEQLGMNHATAANRLRKIILFDLIKEIGVDNCYQCGEQIESVEDLSIEHKIPWLDSDDPKGLYFDLNNIAFSHLSCNSGASRQTKERDNIHGKAVMYNTHGCRCKVCRDEHAKRRREQRRK